MDRTGKTRHFVVPAAVLIFIAIGNISFACETVAGAGNRNYNSSQASANSPEVPAREYWQTIEVDSAIVSYGILFPESLTNGICLTKAEAIPAHADLGNHSHNEHADYQANRNLIFAALIDDGDGESCVKLDFRRSYFKISQPIGTARLKELVQFAGASVIDSSTTDILSDCELADVHVSSIEVEYSSESRDIMYRVSFDGLHGPLVVLQIGLTNGQLTVMDAHVLVF